MHTKTDLNCLKKRNGWQKNHFKKLSMSTAKMSKKYHNKGDNSISSMQKLDDPCFCSTTGFDESISQNEGSNFDEN